MSSFDDTMNLTKRRVLVADDDDCVRTLCVTALRREGYHVDSATNGREALQKLDLSMPFVHGSPLLSIITQTKPLMARRVMVMTGAPDAAVEPLIGVAGAILRKPLDIETLCRVVDQAGTAALEETGRVAL